jgi:hypothetical protein
MKFGKWKVIERGKNRNGRVTWTCECECGRKFDVFSCHLITGQSIQCRVCADTKGNGKHGDSDSRFYRIWEGMKNRCKNETATHYEYYGGKGVKVCDRWEKYINFKNDMFESYITHVEEFGEAETTIDRIDTNGDYEPNNCRWFTRKEQSNNRVDNTYYKYNNQTKTVSQWCDILNINKKSVYLKIYKGFSVSEALGIF